MDTKETIKAKKSKSALVGQKMNVKIVPLKYEH